jgi:MFS family permease
VSRQNPASAPTDESATESAGHNHVHRAGRARQILRALRSRNYRLFFIGQGISLLGTTLQQIALGWFVYRLTGSQVLLGTIGFLNQIPGLVISPFAGAISDRVNGRRALLVVQSGLMVQSLLVAIVVTRSVASIPLLLGLAALQGTLNAFDLPFRQTLVPTLVENREQLPSAIALNSALFNVARILGPSLGGILVASVGEHVCFYANSATYVAVLAALASMRVPVRPRMTAAPKMVVEIAEGLRYVRHHRPIRELLLMLAATNFLGLSYVVMFPVIARDALRGDPHTLGFLMGAAGVGSLLAALRLASRRTLRGLFKSISACALLSSSALTCFVFANSLLTTMALIAVAGFGFISMSGATNTILHALVGDRFRGRVMSLYTVAFVGCTPFGNLALGWLAHRWGVRNAISFSGALLLVVAVIFATRLNSLRAATRPIYIDLGIMPWPED